MSEHVREYYWHDRIGDICHVAVYALPVCLMWAAEQVLWAVRSVRARRAWRRLRGRCPRCGRPWTDVGGCT